MRAALAAMSGVLVWLLILIGGVFVGLEKERLEKSVVAWERSVLRKVAELCETGMLPVSLMKLQGLLAAERNKLKEFEKGGLVK